MRYMRQQISDDPVDYNRSAWNSQAEFGNRWTIPVGPKIIEAARRGNFVVRLTEQKPVPAQWLSQFKGSDILCLASGGGQQAPVFAAAGANVTVVDMSPEQLERDREVADREGIPLTIIQGDMGNLSTISDESFDLIFNPLSVHYRHQVQPVWSEAFRVLRKDGILMTGLVNPVHYIFDLQAQDEGFLRIQNSIPYSDLSELSDVEFENHVQEGEPLEFGHSLSDLIGGLLDAGFVITGFYEDNMADSPLDKYLPTYIAIRALKL